MPATPSPIATTFAKNGISLTPATTTLAETICTDSQITPTELYCKWEAWALTNNATTDAPTLEHLTALQTHIISQKSRTPIKQRRHTKPEPALVYPTGPTPTRVNVDDFFSYLDLPPDNPTPPPSKTEPKPEPQLHHPVVSPTPSSDNPALPTPPPAASALSGLEACETDGTYAARAAAGRVEASLNASDDGTPPTPRVTLREARAAPPPRYMNDPVSSRIQSVRAHTKRLSALILANIAAVRAGDGGEGAVPVVSPEAFFTRSPAPVLAVGRVRVELDESEGVVAGRINPSSVVLESEDGNMVKLDLSRLHQARLPLFLSPGMVVAVEGVNTNGRLIDVHAIYDDTMDIKTMSSRRSKRKAILVKQDPEILPDAPSEDPLSGQPLSPESLSAQPEQQFASVIVAAGPFTTGANLSYEPLEDLLSVIARNKPQVVLLTGPFIDANHAHLTTATPAPFDAIFATRILARLKQAVADMGAQTPHFVLVPSLDDVHHEPVCPQPPFQWPDGQAASPSITLAMNPTVVHISAAGRLSSALGISSLPTLQDISADCISWNKGDRFSAIVSHMLRQRSFYPCFPPSAAVPLDTSFLEHLAMPDLPGRPTVDVIITPSKLKAFTKAVDGGAVAINPGLLCRGSSGGTYAELMVPLHNEDEPRSLNANADLLQASIVRI